MSKQSRTKNILSGGIIALSAVVLAACGSPKDDYSDAQEKIDKANTMDVKTHISVIPDKDGELGTVINNIDINAHVKTDKKKGQTEADIDLNAGFGPMSINLDLPLFIDEKTETIYTKTEGYAKIVDTMSMFIGFPVDTEIPEELQGKSIAFDLEDKEEIDEESVATQEALMNAVKDSMDATIDNVPEEDYTEEDGVVSYTFDGQELVDSILESLVDAEIDTEELGTDVAELQNEIKDVMTVGDVQVVSTIESGNIKKEELTIPITLAETGMTEADAEPEKLTIKVVNEYVSIGEKIEFTFDVSEDNVLTQEEFELEMNKLKPQDDGLGLDESQFDPGFEVDPDFGVEHE